MRQALSDAGLPDDLSDVPVLVGTTLREQGSAEPWWRDGAPFRLADLHFGTSLRRALRTTGSCTMANACAAASYALGLATDMIELGIAETVVVAGTDSTSKSAFGTLDRVQNEHPGALRPCDRSHKRMLMREGAVAVVVQRATSGGTPHARQQPPPADVDVERRRGRRAVVRTARPRRCGVRRRSANRARRRHSA